MLTKVPGTEQDPITWVVANLLPISKHEIHFNVYIFPEKNWLWENVKYISLTSFKYQQTH